MTFDRLVIIVRQRSSRRGSHCEDVQDSDSLEFSGLLVILRMMVRNFSIRATIPATACIFAALKRAVPCVETLVASA